VVRLRDPFKKSSVFLSSLLNGTEICRRRRDTSCALRQFEGVNEKLCSCHLHGGAGIPLILVMSCHAHKLFFEKVSKLVKIFLGVSLVFLEKRKRQKAKGKPS